MNVLIDRLTTHDAIECYNIEKNCFPIVEMFQKHEMNNIISASQIGLKAIYDGKMVGYALARYANRIGYLYSNAVLYDYRNKGIGTMLLNHRMHLLWNYCDIVQAHTQVNNKESARILARIGFKPVQYVPDFYSEGVDATMWENRV